MNESPFYRVIDGAVSRLVRGIVTPNLPPAQELTLSLRELTRVRADTLELVAAISPAQASFKPAPKSWSVAEILDHVLLTEQTYRVQLRRLIDLALAGNATDITLSFKELNPSIAPIPRDVMPLFETPLRLMNPFIPDAFREIMFRFPVIPALNPTVSDPSQQDIALLRTALSESLAATKALFDGAMPPRLLDMTLTHPILGSNNVVKIIRLLTAHEERHHGQIAKVLSDPKAPR